MLRGRGIARQRNSFILNDLRKFLRKSLSNKKSKKLVKKKNKKSCQVKNNKKKFFFLPLALAINKKILYVYIMKLSKFEQELHDFAESKDMKPVFEESFEDADGNIIHESEVIEMMEREEAEEWAALDEARREAWECSTGSI